jgi:hypothetical protein
VPARHFPHPQLTSVSTFGGLSVTVFDQDSSSDLGQRDGVVRVFGLGVVHQKLAVDPLDGLGRCDGAEVEVEV